MMYPVIATNVDLPNLCWPVNQMTQASFIEIKQSN